MPSKTRQRELARLKARREAERRRARRRRALLTYGTLGVLVAVLATAGGVLIANRPESRPAEATATTATPTTVAPTGARIDAPTAPATVACGGSLPAQTKDRPSFKSAPGKPLQAGTTYTATLETSCGKFQVQLDPKSAPLAAANFVALAKRGFYDATWFHRIVPGGDNIGVIQGGDPQGTGQGGPGYTIKDEKAKGKNPYAKYTVAMAKSSAPDSAGSQFFVNTKDNNNAGWNGTYAVFGKVVSGQAVVDKIAQVPVGGQSGDTPTEAVWIQKVTVKES